MKTIEVYLICILILVSSSDILGQSQTKDIKVGEFELKASTVDSELNAMFCKEGELPVFPGGIDSLFSFAEKNLFYPETAISDSVQGTVMLQFTVDTSGNVIDEKVMISVRTDLDTLCLSMLQKMPDWEAGRLEGRAVAVSFAWPIRFLLVKEEE